MQFFFGKEMFLIDLDPREKNKKIQNTCIVRHIHGYSFLAPKRKRGRR